MLNRVLVKLGSDLTIGDPLQGLGPELALQGLRGSLGKLRVSTLLIEVHVVGDLREQLEVIRSKIHCCLGAVVHLADLVTETARILDVFWLDVEVCH